MTNQCGKNSTSGLCNGCVECHSQEKKEECKGCRKFGKREGCYACTPSEEKKWTCPCGKPAPGFDLCSKECEEKYRTDTPPIEDWDMKIRQILSKHWNEWPTKVVENFYSLLSQVREQAYREGQEEAYALDFGKRMFESGRQEALKEVIREVQGFVDLVDSMGMDESLYGDEAKGYNAAKTIIEPSLRNLLAKLTN